ncbi:hypothetical protein CHUAL_004501 [Chamberlinius hualienensis]
MKNVNGTWIEVDQIEVKGIEKEDFWRGIGIWIDRPHILNKRICAINTSKTIYIRDSSQTVTWEMITNEIMFAKDFDFESSLIKFGSISCENQDADFKIQIRNHFPKVTTKSGTAELETLVEDLKNDVVVFIADHTVNEDSIINTNVLLPQEVYALSFVNNSTPTIKLLVYGVDEHVQNNNGVQWLKSKILQKVSQWAKESLTNQPSKFKFPSLRLVSTHEYVTLYQTLKHKYGPKLVEIWPEKTDPHKFVFEDIGIATYLLILWEQQRKETNVTKLQSFVDLGCGNGLLVHILSSEGYPGIGIDVRRRKIWDYFGSNIILKETAFTPSSSDLFPDCDWIIGNHSDELTPWIPVIAARSSPSTNFFLLPCCAHNFDSKFQRRDSKLSQYGDYIEFVSEVIEACGFKVEIDKLRIPSTKRICLVGRHRTYLSQNWPDIDLNIKQFIESQSNKIINHEAGNTDTWAENFSPRPSVQQPRNCTAIEESVKTSIVNTVVDELLRCSDGIQEVSSEEGNKTWRTGGSLELAKVAGIVQPELLRKLKSEFGGLQTLLRNHHHIFQVTQGKVQLRNYYLSVPQSTSKRKVQTQSNIYLKTRPCWFFNNHPDGCLLETNKCPYIHRDHKELRK